MSSLNYRQPTNNNPIGLDALERLLETTQEENILAIEKEEMNVVIKDLETIADNVFKDIMIVPNKFEIERNITFSDEDQSLQNTNELDNFETLENYLIGDSSTLQEQLSNYDDGDFNKFTDLCELKTLREKGIVFVPKDSVELDQIRKSIMDLGYDINSTTFKYTFPEAIKEGSYEKVFSENFKILNELRVTIEDVNKNFNNTLISIIDEEGDEHKFAYKESLTIITAQTGNFKSTLINQIAEAMVSSNSSLELECAESEGVVLVIDSETDKSTLAKRYSNNLDQIDYYSFKLLDNNQMLSKLTLLVEEKKKEKRRIKALVLDSVIDFTADFNDNEDSSNIVKYLEKLTVEYKIPIFVSYQENIERGSNKGGKPSGHLGSKLIQKSAAHYVIKKTKDKVELKGIKNRYDKLFTLQLEIDTSSEFVSLISKGIKKPSLSKAVIKELNLKEAIIDIFKDVETLTTKDFDKILIEKLSISERTAKDYRKKAMVEGLIEEVKTKGRGKHWKLV